MNKLHLHLTRALAYAGAANIGIGIASAQSVAPQPSASSVVLPRPVNPRPAPVQAPIFIATGLVPRDRPPAPFLPGDAALVVPVSLVKGDDSPKLAVAAAGGLPVTLSGGALLISLGRYDR